MNLFNNFKIAGNQKGINTISNPNLHVQHAGTIAQGKGALVGGASRKKIIFLDVDGVLHSVSY